jgi:hypothetical protein
VLLETDNDVEVRNLEFGYAQISPRPQRSRVPAAFDPAAQKTPFALL